ncbi:hypothetical protein E5720_21075 [Rhodococcus sp. PAMC28707]|uniref:hypothetical protein n=1 Tax=unclassified Rhodococcus (in: high G+C Gram-positive bacteria) TaxID=192944 RepID=UPI00109E2EF8|nr:MULTISPECIES: hypothetical protein [unclassified Rhodococcus (in: high G+C Gram-positive bacteria)]QCB51240.1 hypothetical protein E5769_14450 [Rhodococcus sp. PAMC28705]QCB60593.1 hypothetical protein E5720_21075 [Rhodococcus sp. PAMC28707]
MIERAASNEFDIVMPCVGVMFARPEDFAHYFEKNYEPTIARYHRVADDHAAVAAMDASPIELAGQFYEGAAMDWEYLIVTAKVRC